MWDIVVLGILINFVGFILKLKGIDAMPALPIIAGYVYGSSAGILAGVLISASYYLFNPSRLHYSPLTVSTNGLIGFIAGALAGIDIFIAGIGLLIAYHLVSGAVVSIFGGIRPGYFVFVLLNIVVSIAIFYVSSFVL